MSGNDRGYFAEPYERSEDNRAYSPQYEWADRRNREIVSPREEKYTTRRSPTSPTTYRTTEQNPSSYDDQTRLRNYYGDGSNSQSNDYGGNTSKAYQQGEKQANSQGSYGQNEYNKNSSQIYPQKTLSPQSYRKNEYENTAGGYGQPGENEYRRTNAGSYGETSGKSRHSPGYESTSRSGRSAPSEPFRTSQNEQSGKARNNDRDSYRHRDYNKDIPSVKREDENTKNNSVKHKSKRPGREVGKIKSSSKDSNNSYGDTSFDRRLSNSIAMANAHERYKIKNYSKDSIENDGSQSFDRRLSNSIALPNVHDPTKRNKTSSIPKQTKTPTNTPIRTPTKEQPSKIIIDEPVSNLDVTGEKARLLSVRRLDTPDPQRRMSDANESDTSSTISDSDDSPDVFLPKRYILAIMMFLGFVNMYAIRVNLNVAIGAMVNNHTLIKGGVASVEAPEFDWSSRLQGVVLGSFYYGYMVLQIPAGYFAMRFGGTKIFGVAIFLASLFTLVTPFAARFNVWALVILRVLEGLVLGVMLPCNHQIWSLWAPLQERTTLVTIAIAGMNVGTVVTMPLTGLLTKYGFDGGWASVFYCFGVFGILWFGLWVCIAHPSPASHPTISKKERKYIEKNVTTRKSMSIPWKAMLTSRPVWGVIIGNVANDWGLYTILICLPLFLMDIMKFNVQTMGFIASLPFLLKAIVGPVGGLIADILRYKYTTTANVRRIFYAIGAMSAAVMIVIAGYSHTPTMAVISMCIGVALSGLLHSGYEVNVLDIAPCLSGVVMGISNTAGTTTGFLSPLLVGYMTENKLRSEWVTVFWITFFIYLIGTVLFCLLLSGEAQHWALDEDDDKEHDVHRRP